jgi:hypothetical protein
MYICNRIVSVLVALCVFAQWTQAALTPDEIANSLNELAQQGFAAKNLVLVINSTSEAGPIPVSSTFRTEYGVVVGKIE